MRDASGDLVNRALRTYDAQGHVIEEKQVLDNPETMIPSEARAKMLEQSGLSADQLRQELRTQLTKLMAGESGPYSVSYRYDTHGRVNPAREADTAQTTEMSLAGFLRSVACAPNWLAAESVLAQCLPPRSTHENATSMPIPDFD